MESELESKIKIEKTPMTEDEYQSFIEGLAKLLTRLYYLRQARQLAQHSEQAEISCQEAKRAQQNVG